MMRTAPSISRTLTRMNMVVSGTALLLSGLAFAAYDAVSFTQAMVRNLSTQADIVGSNSVSALVFNDPEAAGRTLSALVAAPDIVSAQIYGADGKLFASYWRDGAGQAEAPLAIPADRTEASVISASSVSLARRIIVDRMPTGVVFLRADLTSLYDRLRNYLLIVVVVLIGGGLAALLVSRLARRAIAGPLGEIAALARRVSDDKDYSVRAAVAGNTSELVALQDSFNEMLAQIQTQDRSLQAARAELEDRVRQRTAELDASNRELEAFSYSVSHDLRAPLRHVTGFANLLARHAGESLDAQGRRYLTTITESASRMATLIDDLLAFSRMGRAGLTKRPVDLTALVREARDEVAADLNGRRIVWNLEPLPVVDGDPALLRPMLVNLLSNAVKYSSTREEARIDVGTAERTDAEVVVYVRDNGVGFDMTYAHKLFGVFQRLHRAEDFSGTGIGLANVRRIVQRHGGRTWAEGEIDRGATFYFSLPLTATSQGVHA
jgi:signal transduction histidine kinase